MVQFFPYSPPRRDDTWRTRRDAAVSVGSVPESAMRVPSPPGPKLEATEPIVVESEIVRIEPSMSPGFVYLVAYRADGRPFIRMELPVEAVKAWAIPLERYTEGHDVTRHPKFLELLR